MRPIRQAAWAAALLLGVTGCTVPLASPAPAPSVAPASPTPSIPLDPCSSPYLTTVTAGKLTIGIPNPAPAPFFVDNDPTSGDGFEAALGYAIGKALGFRSTMVDWQPVPVDSAQPIVPGDVDFVMGEITIPPRPRDDAAFSAPYAQAPQVLVAASGSVLGAGATLGGLVDAKLGARSGSRGLATIKGTIRPTTAPVSLASQGALESALRSGTVDGVIVDALTARRLVDDPAAGLVIVGSLGEATDDIGLAFAPGNPLIDCVNGAMGTLTSDGTIADLQSRWLPDLGLSTLVD